MKKCVTALIALALALGIQSTATATEELVHVIKFTDYQGGAVEDWLKVKGFQFKEDAKYRNRIDLNIDDRGLIVEAQKKVLGLMPNETVDIPDFTFIEVDWGVEKHPAGASYEQGIRNEALMVFVFMGDELSPSGSMFIPDSPYFIGLFLCSGDDRENHPYIGSYFKKGGRYICTNHPRAGEMVTSRFNLLDGYQTYFDKAKKHDPGISGIGLGLDTKKASDKGRTLAFIREIRFYK